MPLPLLARRNPSRTARRKQERVRLERAKRFELSTPTLGKLGGPWRQKQKSPAEAELFRVSTGAGEEIRTLDPNLGK
ncbi:MAG: hypothetical protein V4707_11550, partial [Pseudomonadota bacterium]